MEVASWHARIASSAGDPFTAADYAGLPVGRKWYDDRPAQRLARTNARRLDAHDGYAFGCDGIGRASIRSDPVGPARSDRAWNHVAATRRRAAGPKKQLSI